MMKVFTVGLDQKPPLEETKSEKSDSPPPGYSTTSSARIPLPMGPELPRPPLPPPAPIIVRKSRGYKGILLALLAVFLMAVFALTLSEMAYNRQREENFFKLRWAELKHHMGYDNEGPYGYYQSAASSVGEKFDRLLNLIRSNELAQQQQVDQQQASTISSTAVPLPSPEPVVAIDSFPMLPSRPSSASSSQQASSVEVEPPQPPAGMLGDANGPFGGQLRDARLQFLRNILQKIKQHAEDIGFDGTMQVSIIEVEPQNGAEGNGDNAAQASAGNQQQQMMPWMAQRGPFPAQVLPQQFFPHPRPLIDELKNSRSFLDGFGEFHQPQPNFMQNNQVAEPEERPRPPMFGPWAQQPPHNELVQQSPQGNGPEFVDNLRWQRLPPLFRQPPEMLFFHPFFPPQQQQQQQPMMNNMNMRFPPPPPPPTSEWAQAPQQQMPAQQMPALPRPSAFDRWNGPQGPMMFPQPQQQQQQQQPLPFQLPQQQQIQIDFPEVKLPPPIIGDNNNEDSNNKFEPVPPSSSSQQPPAEEQPKWLPKWAVDSDSQNSGQNENQNEQNQNDNQNQNDQNIGGAGPPAVQPPDMIKFPSVTVVEPAKNVADNEEVVQGQTQTDGTQAPPPAESEKKEQPEEVVEVDPPQPIAPQNDQQQPEIKTGQDQPAEQQQQLPQQQHPQFQKWFPEVPSVFFQVDDPNGNSGGDGALHLPKPNSDSSSEHSSSDSGDDSDGDEQQPSPKQQEQQQQAQAVHEQQEHDDHHQPHLVVD